MKSRRVLSSILAMSVTAVGFVYLLLPAFSQEKIPATPLTTLTKPPLVPKTTQHLPTGQPAFTHFPTISSTGGTGTDAARGKNIRALELRHHDRMAAMVEKEAELADLHTRIVQVQKRRDALRVEVESVSKALSKAIADLRKQADKADQNGPSDSQLDPFSLFADQQSNSPAPGSHSAISEDLNRKFDRLSRRLETIEKKLDTLAPRK
ncbi:hypothetical protein BH10PLA2_BH10PLA2_13620 [soil metagenome]